MSQGQGACACRLPSALGPQRAPRLPGEASAKSEGMGLVPSLPGGTLTEALRCVLALLLTPGVILAKLLPFSGPQFPIFGMGRLN